MSSSVEAACAALTQANAVAVLTGAGVSAESGIPTFRSNGGYWRTHRFEDLATPQGFARDPKFVWEWYEERRRAIASAVPNAGHLALVELERRVQGFTLITQNVDGLHDLAGSKNIVKLHGDIWVLRCLGCGRERVDRAVLSELPPYCGCGATMRPGVVWFGEMLPERAMERATEAVRNADVVIVAGTSARVYPAAGLIPLAIQRGAAVIEINPEATGYSDEVTFSLRGASAEILPRLIMCVGAKEVMATAKKSQIPPAKLELYEKLIATVPEIDRKGAVHPYTSVNGHMFTYLDQTGTLGIRLSKDEVAAFLKKYKTRLFESYGVVKKDWVTVPEALFENTKELKKYLQTSYEYVKTLKPK